MSQEPQIERGRGFHLNDLLVLIAIVAVLAGMLLPAIKNARAAAQVRDCQNNLRQIGRGIHGYAGDHSEKLPPLLDYEPTGKPAYWQPFWFSVLPYIEDTPVSDRVNEANAWDNGNHSTVMNSLLCPSDRSHSDGTSLASGWSVTSYVPVQQLFGNYYMRKNGPFIQIGKYTIGNIPDGTSQQISVVERYGHFPAHGWSNTVLYPSDNTYWGWNQWSSVYGVWGLNFPQIGVRPVDANPYYPNSGHREAQVLLLDGSVKSITASVSLELWMSFCTPDGNDGSRDW